MVNYLVCVLISPIVFYKHLYVLFKFVGLKWYEVAISDGFLLILFFNHIIFVYMNKSNYIFHFFPAL